MKGSVLVVDPLAGDTGHLLNDDAFYTNCLRDLYDAVEVRTSPASAAKLQLVTNQEVTPGTAVEIRALPELRMLDRLPRLQYVLRLAAIGRPRAEHVFFVSFEEVSTLLFALVWRTRRIHLLAHNNLGLVRFERHPRVMAALWRPLLSRVQNVLVASRFAVRLLETRFGAAAVKARRIPFHHVSMGHPGGAWNTRRPMILFAGPVQGHKRLEPLIDMIRRDEARRYEYVVLKPSGLSSDAAAFLSGRSNVQVVAGYLEPAEYDSWFRRARYVLLTHDQSFEGKLSGVLADALAAGTPVIARKLAPATEFSSDYGSIGFLADFHNADWTAEVFSNDNEEMYERFQENISRVRRSCARDRVLDTLRAALLTDDCSQPLLAQHEPRA